MTTLKVVSPLLWYRSRILQSNCLFHQIKRKASNNKQTAIVKNVRTEVDTNVKPLGERVKETTKTVSYLGVILVGVGVTGALFYAVFRELFSSKSPNNVYSRAVKHCKQDVRIQDKLGLPITAHGFETRRGRRQHVTHIVYQREGKKCIRMKFYLNGAFHKGTVQLEMMEDDSGYYEYRYLFVEVDDILRSTIVLEDNRDKFDLVVPSSELSFT